MNQGTISKALGASYSSLEEAKADVMGVYNILYMIRRGELRQDLRHQSLVTYVAGLFRSIRCEIMHLFSQSLSDEVQVRCCRVPRARGCSPAQHIPRGHGRHLSR